MSISTPWQNLIQDKPGPVAGNYYVAQVDAYFAHPVTYSYWRAKLKHKGWVGGYLFCHDLVLVSEDGGHKVRVMIHPLSDWVQQGLLRDGMFINMTRVMQISVGKIGNFDGNRFLVLLDWNSAPSFSVDLKKIQIPAYSGETLCPWTYANLMISSYRPLPRNGAVPKLPNYDPVKHNLLALNKAYSTVEAYWPLLVRVLAKSKERLLIKQDNEYKPKMTLCNLLVADTTGYCALTLWDDAVVVLGRSVMEGDLLALDRMYKVGRYKAAQEKLIYRLAPKVRYEPAISPCEIEIKVNISDLSNIRLIHPAATCPQVPLPLWNFYNVNQLLQGDLTIANGRLVDFVGVVVHHGRWERERCLDQSGNPTGQYWVRVWFVLGDQTSDSVVGVKMYVVREKWEEVERIIPGEAVIMTNLLFIHADGGQFSHLEGSNETQVFSGGAAGDSRFGANMAVLDFREAYYGEMNRWAGILKERGGFGGSIHPALKVQVGTAGFVMEKKEEVDSCFSSLVFRGCGRILVRAAIREIIEFEVTNSGECVRTSDEHVENGNDPSDVVFGSKKPKEDSLKRTLLGLNKVGLKNAIRQYCHLNSSIVTEVEDAYTREGLVVMVSLVMEDCTIWVLSEVIKFNEVKEIFGSLSSEKGCFCLDVFRFEPRQPEQSPCFGVEIVLRSILKPLTHDSVSLDDTGGDRSLLVTTQDLANAFK